MVSDLQHQLSCPFIISNFNITAVPGTASIPLIVKVCTCDMPPGGMVGENVNIVGETEIPIGITIVMLAEEIELNKS